MRGLSLTPPTPLRIQLKQMAWELLQNVGRQKDESRWAGRGKRCWQAKWQQGCFPSRTSLHAARAGAGDASSVRRQFWATGSCCGLAGGVSKDKPLLSPQIILMCPPPETHLQMAHRCSHGEAALRDPGFPVRSVMRKLWLPWFQKGLGPGLSRDAGPQAGVKGPGPAWLRGSHLPGVSWAHSSACQELSKPGLEVSGTLNLATSPRAVLPSQRQFL